MTGGINVSLAEVEEVLLFHPVVVSLPDPEREEAIAAIVAERSASQAEAA